MFAMILQEANRRGIAVEARPMAIMKRGICSFAEKAKALTKGGAALGVIVNSDGDSFIDMPRGKESTDNCTTPIGSVMKSDGELLQYEATSPGETLAIITGNTNTNTNDDDDDDDDGGVRGYSKACKAAMALVEEIVDKWPHSVPPVPMKEVLAATAPGYESRRKLADEGGRIAVSGSNGWAFFDYHLALFGSQEVPLKPLRLVFANPPHGCDPKAYLNRVSGAAVAILRGGGCSFGIKVLNAQSLGAKVVLIVNSEKGRPLQRLMALRDEEELITVPTIMISYRIKTYYERLLKRYQPIDQLLVSVQPTGLHGRYEER